MKKIFFSALLTILLISFSSALIINYENSDYNVTSLVVGSATEYRFYFTDHHFLTIIDDRGTFNIRPHPGTDINGWGSSLYMQPFLPGATLKHTTIQSINIGEGINVQASGFVSRWSDSTYGTWSFNMSFNYNQSAKKITGNGGYSINLDNTISSSTGDLNLYKLASNYLDNVPLLTGGIGDTGDMKTATISSPNTQPNFIWNPSLQPAHFPGDITDLLSIDVSGELNNIDTVAQNQGYEPISPAYKPSLKVELNSLRTNEYMIFGGIYDLSKSQDFWEDNVGITPLITQSSPHTDFEFEISFESQALPGDGNDRDFDTILDSEDNCPDIKNKNQTDSNSDGVGDVCTICLDGDITLDGEVDGADLSLMSANWLGTNKTFEQGDITGDHNVDGADLSLMAANWLKSTGPCTRQVLQTSAKQLSLQEEETADQFCESITITSNKNHKKCLLADWQNNEPKKRNPLDCTIKQNRKTKEFSCIARKKAD